MSDYHRRYQILFDNMAQGVFIRLADGTIVDVNPATLNMFGLSREQFLREAFGNSWKLISEDGSELPPEQYPSRIALRTGRPVRDMVAGVFNPRKNELVWLVVNAIPLARDDEDHPWQVLVTLHDITERKRAVAALQQREELLQLFIEHVPASLAMFDREMRYLCASRRWKSDYSLGQRDLTGRSHYEIFPEISSEWREVHRRCLAGEVLRAEADRFERLDGSVQWVRWEIHPWRDAAGEIGGILIFTEDITARKRDDEALRQAKEAAEAATRAKGQFLANMSHELRTPMTGLLGRLDLALQGELSAEQRLHLEAANKSAHALLRILNDILDFSKIEAGMIVLVEEPFDLHELARRALVLFEIEAQRKGLDLVVEIAPGTPEIVVGDEGRIRQILLNLIGNAVKFTDQGRVSLQVAAGEEKVASHRQITFTVADTGIGIPRENQQQLFQPFTQLDDSHSRLHGGTGLGLSICREVAARMGGALSFTSETGRGTTFVVDLPLRESITQPSAVSPGETAAPVPLTINAGRPRLLVAEDDPDIRNLLGVLLQQMDIEFASACNGAEAFEMWARGGYNLILMDVQMPRMDGFEVTRAIRLQEESQGGHVPIVALTAHAYATDRQKCQAAGMDSYLAKPFDRHCLVAVLDEFLGSRFSG